MGCSGSKKAGAGAAAPAAVDPPPAVEPPPAAEPPPASPDEIVVSEPPPKAAGDRPLKLGVIRLDYDYPPSPGDIDHPESYDYPVEYRVVKGLTFEMCQGGKMTPEVETNFVEAIKYFDAQGFSCIAGDCGFMLWFQSLARQHTTKPIFLSSLAHLPAVTCAYGPKEKIAIFTANSASLALMRELIREQCGVDSEGERFVIVGCEDVPGFEAVAAGDKVDVVAVTPGIVAKAKAVLAADPAIKAILMECTELPQFSDAVRVATGLPVYDAITCCDFFIGSFADNPRFGITTAPEVTLTARAKAAGAALGVVRLDYDYTPAPGDIDHPDSFAYDVHYHVVPGLTFEMCQSATLSDEAEQQYLAVIKALEDKGVAGITGDCGFYMWHQVSRHSCADVTHAPRLWATRCSAYLESSHPLFERPPLNLVPSRIYRSCRWPTPSPPRVRHRWCRGRCIWCPSSCDEMTMTVAAQQARARAATTGSTPVFMSALAQLPAVTAAFGPDEKIAIFTANSTTLGPMYDLISTECAVQPADARFVIVGCQDVAGFEAVAAGGKVDVAAVTPGIVAKAKATLAEHPTIRAILMECTELPPYSDAVRAATNLPVFDAITVCDLFINGCVDNPRFGIDDWEAYRNSKIAKSKAEPLAVADETAPLSLDPVAEDPPPPDSSSSSNLLFCSSVCA